MKNFNQDRRSGPSDRGDRGRKFGGGSSFGGGSRGGFGGRDSSPSMHQATCSACGKSCEVPFKPMGGKPVFCNDCFKNNGKPAGGRFSDRDSGPSRFSDRDRGGDRPRFEDKKMYHAVCDSCGDDCELPFKPMGSKPVYCSNCFGKNEDSSYSKPEFRDKKPAFSAPAPSKDAMASLTAKVDELKIQLDKMTAKLDRVLREEAPVFSEAEAKKAETQKPKKVEVKQKEEKKAPIKKLEKKAAVKKSPEKKVELKKAVKSVKKSKAAQPSKKAVVKKPAPKGKKK